MCWGGKPPSFYFVIGIWVIQIEKVLVFFLLPPDNVLSQGQALHPQHLQGEKGAFPFLLVCQNFLRVDFKSCLFNARLLVICQLPLEARIYVHTYVLGASYLPVQKKS